MCNASWSPEERLVESVKILEWLMGVSLSRVYIGPAERRGEPGSWSVSLETHFLGRTVVLEETVHQEVDHVPHVRREESRDGVRVSSITFISPLDAVVNSWPGVARLIPRHHELVVVTLEEARNDVSDGLAGAVSTDVGHTGRTGR